MLSSDENSHTNIDRVQQYLIKTLDMPSESNTKFVNEMQMTMYLKGIGMWNTVISNDNETMLIKNLPSLTNENNSDNQLDFKAIDEIIQNTNEMLNKVNYEVSKLAEGPDPKHVKLIPDFPITVVIIGKPFVGKSTQVRKLTQKYALQLLNVDDLIGSTIQSYKTKLITSDVDTKITDDTETELELTQQEQLGKHIISLLEQGNVIDDESYINVIFNEINRLNTVQNDEEKRTTNGWVIDGWPITRQQFELFELKLTGYQPDTKATKKKGKSNSKKAKAGDSSAAEEDTISSGIDLVIYLDIPRSAETEERDLTFAASLKQSDEPKDPKKDKKASSKEDCNEQPPDVEAVMKESHKVLFDRARGRLILTESEEFHMITNPPPDDKAFKTSLTYPDDDELVSNLPEHFLAFDQRKPEIREWCQTFGNLRELDCNQDKPSLTQDIFNLVEEKLSEKKSKDDALKQQQEELEKEKEMEQMQQANKLKDESNENEDEENNDENEEQEEEKPPILPVKLNKIQMQTCMYTLLILTLIIYANKQNSGIHRWKITTCVVDCIIIGIMHKNIINKACLLHLIY